MKRYVISILFLLFACSCLFSQVQIEWAKCYGGTANDFGYTAIQTTDQGFFVAGIAAVNSGDVSGVHGGWDIWVLKLDYAGNIQWQKCLGGTNDEYVNSVKQTSDNGFIVCGKTRSNDGDVSGNNGGYDVWVVKLDSTGNIQWQKCVGGNYDDIGNSVIQTSNDDFIIAGNTSSTNGYITGNHGSADAWIVKLSFAGDYLWNVCLGGTETEQASSIIQTSAGCFIFSGRTSSNNGDVAGNHGMNDMWVVKLDASANIQWQRCYGGSLNDYAEEILKTSNGGYVIAGSTESMDGDITWNISGSNSWVVNVDSVGNILWQKSFGGSSTDMAKSVYQTSDGGYVVSSWTQSQDGDVLTHYGLYDFWLVDLSSAGDILWQNTLGGTDADCPYTVEITNDNGCFVFGHTISNDIDVNGNHGGYDYWLVKLRNPSIKGYVFLDENENGISDTGEQKVAGHIIKVEPGPFYAISNNAGYYYFSQTPGAYTVRHINQQNWYCTGVNTYNVSVDSINQCIDTLNFGIKSRINVNDMSVFITGAPVRASMHTHYFISYKNMGSVTESGTITFIYDSLLTYINSSLAPFSHTGNTLAFDYDTIGPGVQRLIRVDFQVPGIQYLGSNINSDILISPLIPDTNTINNYDTLYQAITGSYDPNDKTVSPTGYEQWGFVEQGQRLTYTIRFQNTGTDTAFSIVIRDTINSNMDLSTFEVDAYSHPVTWQLMNGNELYFRFDNILLPDSNINEPESHGFIRYSISPKPGLADNTNIFNTAYIFFDYNPAIVTNTTQNIYVTNIPVDNSVGLCPRQTKVYPNPSDEMIYINLPKNTSLIKVYDINGNLMYSLKPMKQVAEIDIRQIPSGVYIVKMQTNKNVVTTKFVKE